MFEVTDASIESGTVEVGEDATVEATVENLGGESGTHTVELRAENESVAGADVDVAGESTETVSLSFAPEEAGEYALIVDDEDAGVLVVDQVETDDDGDPTAQEPDDTTDGDGGFDAIVLAGLLAIVVATLFAAVLWRRRDEEHNDEYLD